MNVEEKLKNFKREISVLPLSIKMKFCRFLNEKFIEACRAKSFSEAHHIYERLRLVESQVLHESCKDGFLGFIKEHGIV